MLAGIGATITIGILAFITYETKMGLWLMASFGSTVVVVFGYPDYIFAQPKNVLFGHVVATLVGILFVTFFNTIVSNFSY